MTGSRTGTVPPWPTMRRVTPCQPRNRARVTTNDGIRTTLTRTPVNRPITAPTTMAVSTAQYQSMPERSIITAITAAQTPLTTPADRSISPSSRTKPRPIPSRLIGTACTSRLVMFSGVGKVSGRSAVNRIARTTMPATAGSAPRSPPRTRLTQPRTYPPTESSTTSPSKPDCGAGFSGASVADGCTVLDIGSDSYFGGGRGCDAQIARAAGGDEFDDAGAVDLGDGHVGGDAPEVEGGHPVGDLEHVDHVVRDEDDRVAVVGQPADEVEHLPG